MNQPLRNSRYSNKVENKNENISNKNNRKRNIIWFTPAQQYTKNKTRENILQNN